MLRNVTDLHGYTIRATDGIIGTVDDMYFDDEDWAIRYLAVDTGHWLSGRKVLISPIAIGHPDWMGRLLPVSLTRAQVEGSPDIDTRKPVSRQHETDYVRYFLYPKYWGGAGLWGMGGDPVSLRKEVRTEVDVQPRVTPDAMPDTHLRSCQAVIGYRIHATDGDIGHVKDFLVEEHTWAIRYLIVKTSHWWIGHYVPLAPQWADAVSWSDRTVSVNLTRQAIQDAPPYDPSVQFSRQREQASYEHYGHHEYWAAPDRDDSDPSSQE